MIYESDGCGRDECYSTFVYYADSKFLVLYRAALAQANAIMTGWRIGAKEFEECDRGTRKSCDIWSYNSNVCFAAFAMSGHFIIHIFTDDTK